MGEGGGKEAWRTEEGHRHQGRKMEGGRETQKRAPGRVDRQRRWPRGWSSAAAAPPASRQLSHGPTASPVDFPRTRRL